MNWRVIVHFWPTEGWNSPGLETFNYLDKLDAENIAEIYDNLDYVALAEVTCG